MLANPCVYTCHPLCYKYKEAQHSIFCESTCTDIYNTASYIIHVHCSPYKTHSVVIVILCGLDKGEGPGSKLMSMKYNCCDSIA